MNPRADQRSRTGARAIVAPLLCSLLAGTVLPASGCGKSVPAEAAGAPAAQKHVYSVRALIVSLPAPGERDGEIVVRHEAMPHFVGQDGQLGMDTMTMPFPLASGFVVDGLAPGDKITLTFEVDYDDREKKLLGYRATRAEKLAPDAALDFTSLTR